MKGLFLWKEDDFTSCSTLFITYSEKKNLFETLGGRAVEPIDNAALEEAPTNQQREAQRSKDSFNRAIGKQ